MATATRDRFLTACYREFLLSLRTAPPVEAYLTTATAGGGLFGTVLGWVLYLWSSRVAPGAAQHALREAAGVGAGLGFPLVLAGLVGLLTAGPHRTRPRFRWATVAGTLLTTAAVGLFVVGYPSRWDTLTGPDLAPLAVTLYGVGLASILFVAGAAAGCRCSTTPVGE